MACFEISGKVPNEKDKLIRSDIGLDKHFFEIFKNSGRNTTWASCFVCFSSVLKMSSTSSFVVDDKKEFSFEFFKYEWKDLGVSGILLTRFFATYVKKSLKWFEIVRSSVIVSLSIFRFISGTDPGLF